MIVCIRSFYAVKLRAIDALVVVAEVDLLVQFETTSGHITVEYLATKQDLAGSCSGLCIPDPRGRHVFKQ